MDSKKIVIVVPCYNEASRLRAGEFLAALQKEPHLHWLFVNDGSSDKTQEVLNSLQSQKPKKIETLALEKNKGKGEAVRADLSRRPLHLLRPVSAQLPPGLPAAGGG